MPTAHWISPNRTRSERGLCALAALLAISELACSPATDDNSAEILARLDAMDRRLQSIESRVGNAGSAAGPAALPRHASPGSQQVEAPGKAAGGLAVDSPTHAFGEVWGGVPVEHAFRLHNGTDAPIDLRSVTPNCSCVVLGAHADRIAPGGELSIPARLETTKLKGGVRQTITVRTSDAERPEIVLAFTGTVRQVVDYESFVVIRARPNDAEKEHRVKMRMQAPGNLQLTLRPRPEDRFEATLEETLPGREFDLVIRVAPPFAPGYQRCVIEIDTNQASPKTLAVRVHLLVPERIDAVPKKVLVDPQAVAGTSRRVQVKNWGERDVRLTAARADLPGVGVDIETVSAGREYSVLVTFETGFRLPAGGGRLHLETDDAELRELIVPIQSRQTAASSGATRSRPALQLIGKPAPAVSLATLEGEPVTTPAFAEYTGTLLNFFAPNCGYCKKQIPQLEELRGVWESQGIRFVNVAERMGRSYTEEETAAVLDALGARLEVAIDPGNQVGRRFLVSGFPTLFIVGPDGVVRHVAVGAGADFGAEIGAQLEALAGS